MRGYKSLSFNLTKCGFNKLDKKWAEKRKCFKVLLNNTLFQLKDKNKTKKDPKWWMFIESLKGIKGKNKLIWTPEVCLHVYWTSSSVISYDINIKMKTHKPFKIRNIKWSKSIKYYLTEDARFKAESHTITECTWWSSEGTWWA